MFEKKKYHCIDVFEILKLWIVEFIYLFIMLCKWKS